MNHQHDTTTHAECCTPHPGRDGPTHPAVESTPSRAGGLSVGGSVVAAVLSSACCWLPLLLVGFGASAGGVSVFFERWRPVFAGIALVLLGVGFYAVYFRKAACADGSCAARSRRARVTSRVMLWVAAVLVGAFVLFPKYAGSIARAINGFSTFDAASTTDAALAAHRFRVEGMSCEACAVTLQADFAKIDGVASAEVDYASKSATVWGTNPDVGARVGEAAEKHGYHAYPQ